MTVVHGSHSSGGGGSRGRGFSDGISRGGSYGRYGGDDYAGGYGIGRQGWLENWQDK